jgi:hypothetical protein
MKTDSVTCLAALDSGNMSEAISSDSEIPMADRQRLMALKTSRDTWPVLPKNADPRD